MTNSVTVSAGIIAVVAFIKQHFPQVKGWVTMVIAVVLGGVAGFFHLEGLDLTSGIMAGLTAVAGVTVADRIGTNK